MTQNTASTKLTKFDSDNSNKMLTRKEETLRAGLSWIASGKSIDELTKNANRAWFLAKSLDTVGNNSMTAGVSYEDELYSILVSTGCADASMIYNAIKVC